MSIKNERRRLTRRELIYYPKITDRSTGDELGRLGDLHWEGLLLLSPEPLAVGLVYDLALELPKTLAEKEGLSEIFLRAEVMWNRPGPKNRNFSESGLRFVESASPSQPIIAKLTEIFGMPG